jgi:hypothetical protein
MRNLAEKMQLAAGEIDQQKESFQRIKDMIARKIGNGCPGGEDHVGVVVKRLLKGSRAGCKDRFLSCEECGLWLRNLTDEEADFILCLQNGGDPDPPVAPGEKKTIILQYPGHYGEADLDKLREVLDAENSFFRFVVIPRDVNDSERGGEKVDKEVMSDEVLKLTYSLMEEALEDARELYYKHIANTDVPMDISMIATTLYISRWEILVNDI